MLGHAVGDVVLHQLRLLMAAEGQLKQNRRQDRAAYDRDDDRRHHRGRQHTHRKAAVGDDQRDFAAAGHAHADPDALARGELARLGAKAAAEELRDDRNKQQQNREDDHAARQTRDLHIDTDAREEHRREQKIAEGVVLRLDVGALGRACDGKARGVSARDISDAEELLSAVGHHKAQDKGDQPGEGILHHAEGVDLIPANIELAGLEVSLVNCMNREKMLKQVLEGAKYDYDFILLDCTPSLGMLTVNALAAADTTLIPVQAQYLSAKGLEQLLQTVQKVRRQINPKLKIEGILLTMTDNRTNYGQQIDNLIRGAYGSKIKVFDQTIPRSVRAAEISAVGKSIFQHDPKGKVAEAYKSLTEEVMQTLRSDLPPCAI